MGETALPSKFVRPFGRDQVIRVQMAGGGGFGEPLARDPAAVLEDVRQEKISIEHARTAYGVAIDSTTLTVDREATETLRRRPA